MLHFDIDFGFKKFDAFILQLKTVLTRIRLDNINSGVTDLRQINWFRWIDAIRIEMQLQHLHRYRQIFTPQTGKSTSNHFYWKHKTWDALQWLHNLLMLAVVWLFRETQVKWKIAGLITETHVIQTCIACTMFVAAVLTPASLSLWIENIQISRKRTLIRNGYAYWFLGTRIITNICQWNARQSAHQL